MKIGGRDDFENVYMGKFRALAAPHGVFVEYERDRAGRDIGLNLTQTNLSGDGKIMSPALVWFQMKGIMASTLSLSEYERLEDIAIDLDVGHLRFWYMAPQPTYLAVYVQSADEFLAIDIKAWVGEHYGDGILSLDRKTVRVRIGKRLVLDDDFFRQALSRNLVPVLRRSLAADDDRGIARFIRDSAVVKWLVDCGASDTEVRLTIRTYMSKTRTEAYFESREEDGEWIQFRGHWQYMMGAIEVAFPYLDISAKCTAEQVRWTEQSEDLDGEPFEILHQSFAVHDADTGEEIDTDEFDRECLLDIGNERYSYGEMYGGEMIEHRLGIALNEIGERWARTLDILLRAEVISVEVEPHMISVAPWHARGA